MRRENARRHHGSHHGPAEVLALQRWRKVGEAASVSSRPRRAWFIPHGQKPRCGSEHCYKRRPGRGNRASFDGLGDRVELSVFDRTGEMKGVGFWSVFETLRPSARGLWRVFVRVSSSCVRWSSCFGGTSAGEKIRVRGAAIARQRRNWFFGGAPRPHWSLGKNGRAQKYRTTRARISSKNYNHRWELRGFLIITHQFHAATAINDERIGIFPQPV